MCLVCCIFQTDHNPTTTCPPIWQSHICNPYVVELLQAHKKAIVTMVFLFIFNLSYMTGGLILTYLRGYDKAYLTE
jgi:hypothetical protein